MNLRHILTYFLGGLGALLLARLLLSLLAARPDNPAFKALFGLTAPLVAPLQFLDAGQPRFGAVLELSTLALIVLLMVVALAVWSVLGRGKQDDRERYTGAARR
jgi:uncharacterized protein YggT (Ycf19 family)